MRWATFKQVVEKQGVTDDMEIRSIDLLDGWPVVSFTMKHVIIDGRFRNAAGDDVKEREPTRADPDQ